MRKDTVVATIVGFTFGLIVASAVVKLPNILKNGIKLSFNLPKLSFSEPKSSPTSSPKIQNTPNLTITNPNKADILTDKNKINISGNTKKGAVVTIDTNLETKVITADDGTFASDLNLEEGTNNFLITTYIDKETSDSKTLIVSYIPEKL